MQCRWFAAACIAMPLRRCDPERSATEAHSDRTIKEGRRSAPLVLLLMNLSQLFVGAAFFALCSQESQQQFSSFAPSALFAACFVQQALPFVALAFA